MAARTAKALSKRVVATICLMVGMFVAGEVAGQVEEPVFLSLKDVPVPEPPPEILAEYVRDKAVAVALGKALFWDMQVGSDGFTACATCHFNGGADIRDRNQLSPGLLGADTRFGNSGVGNNGHPGFGPNHTLTASDFPFHQRVNPTARVPRPPLGPIEPEDRAAELVGILRDTNDVVSSQGVKFGEFLGLRPRNNPVELGFSSEPDPLGFLITRGRRSFNVRRAEPRNAPTVINAVFNYENFHEGRASLIFNGATPFGFRDTQSRLKRIVAGVLVDWEVRIPNASLASQAMAPPVSDMEMSLAGRSFPMIGRKLLGARPLARQLVHPEDSVLGSFSRARHRPGRLIPGRVIPERVIGGRVIPERVVGRRVIPERVFGRPGLTIENYADMVRVAFQPDWWSSNDLIGVEGDRFTQMEFNFSLFFGLALQLYQATLVSDDTPFDRFQEVFRNAANPDEPDRTHPNWNALTPQELLGYDIFFGENFSGQNPTGVDGRCTACHVEPELTAASVREVQVSDGTDGVPAGVPLNAIEIMVMGDGEFAAYDNGFYNIATRPTDEDLARGFRSPANLGVTLSGEPLPLSYSRLALLKQAGELPDNVARWVPDFPALPGGATRVVVDGAFKTPSLRNIEFTGPYFHSGSEATLRQVVDFYTRGGNFPVTNFDNLDLAMGGIVGLDLTRATSEAERAIIEERIRALVAFLSNGLTDDRVRFERAPFDHPQLIVPNGVNPRNPRLELRMTIPAVGRNGRLEPLPRFMGLDPQAP